MRVLVLGGGGREHALAWKLAASPSVTGVVTAPGNPGCAAVGRCRGVDPTDPAAVVALATDEAVDLVVVGPEAPLVAGVTDALRLAGIPCFGPSAAAARLESSKVFAKEVMALAEVPTARSWSGADVDGALAALDDLGPPYVVKADGLAAGKGVVVTGQRDEAEAAVRAALEEGAFGEAGSTVVVEAYLDGPEVSVFAVTDGTSVVPLAAARDHKRALDGDQGPNTGGMGAVSPAPGVDERLLREVRTSILEPVVAAMRRRETPYVGVLYAGLVLTAAGPQVLEFNARLGDPEAQVVLPRLRSDLGELLLAAATGRLDQVAAPVWDPRACVGVVLASGGYPGTYEVGRSVHGVAEAEGPGDVHVFHAGTATDEVGRLVTTGGRVLAVTALAEDTSAARAAAYDAADRIDFEGLHRRSDIAGP